jgi:CHAT domain-containing protein
MPRMRRLRHRSLLRTRAADELGTVCGHCHHGMLSRSALLDGPGAVDGSGHTVYSYAHPMFWAPYSVIGDGGGT